MAEDMYSYLDRQQPKKKADRSIVGALIIAAVLLVGIGLVIYSALHQRVLYREFTSDMSSATSAGTVTASMDGDVILLTQDHKYALYQVFTQNAGKIRKSVPQDDPFVVFTYGNGAVLECWETKLESHVQRKNGICWRFTTPDETVWIFDTSDFGYNDVRRLVNAPDNKHINISG